MTNRSPDDCQRGLKSQRLHSQPSADLLPQADIMQRNVREPKLAISRRTWGVKMQKMLRRDHGQEKVAEPKKLAKGTWKCTRKLRLAKRHFTKNRKRSKSIPQQPNSRMLSKDSQPKAATCLQPQAEILNRQPLRAKDRCQPPKKQIRAIAYGCTATNRVNHQTQSRTFA